MEQLPEQSGSDGLLAVGWGSMLLKAQKRLRIVGYKMGLCRRCMGLSS
jgi:hypothetical protein